VGPAINPLLPPLNIITEHRESVFYVSINQSSWAAMNLAIIVVIVAIIIIGVCPGTSRTCPVYFCHLVNIQYALDVQGQKIIVFCN
jgi:membrane protein YdbS with pleckstrin-like domain